MSGSVPLHAVLTIGYEGHRLYHVRLLAEELERRGRRTRVHLDGRAPASPEFATHLSALCDRGAIEVVTFHDPDDAAAVIGEVLGHCQADGVDLTVLDADSVLLPLLVQWRRRVPRLVGRSMWVQLMRPSPIDRSLGALVRWAGKLFVALLLQAHRRVHVRALGGQDGPPRFPRVPVAVVHDPLPRVSWSGTRVEARSLLDLPTDRTIFAVVGMLTEYKAIPLLLQAWQLVRARGLKPLLLLAGAPTEQIRELLQQPDACRLADEDLLQCRLGFLDDESFDAYVTAADALLLTYHYDAASGLLGRALQTGTPVVTAGSSTVARGVAATGIGVATKLAAEPLAKVVMDITTGALAPARWRTPEVEAAGYRERAAASECAFARGLLPEEDSVGL